MAHRVALEAATRLQHRVLIVDGENLARQLVVVVPSLHVDGSKHADAGAGAHRRHDGHVVRRSLLLALLLVGVAGREVDLVHVEPLLDGRGRGGAGLGVTVDLVRVDVLLLLLLLRVAGANRSHAEHGGDEKSLDELHVHCRGWIPVLL